MADTGAPWNLPYPLPTDLVRDGADAIKDLAEAVADGLDDAGSEGIGPNVVQGVLKSTFSTSSSTYTTITGLTATITPSSATSKVLIIAQVSCSINNADNVTATMRIAGGNATDYVGDAGGANQPRGLNSLFNSDFSLGTAYARHRSVEPETFVYLDSPASASPVTYSVEVLTNGTFYVGRNHFDGNFVQNPRTASSITVIEVKA